MQVHRPYVIAVPSVAALLIVLTVGWPLSLKYISAPDREIQWIDAIYKNAARASKIDGPKIWLVGGSEVHYGFSAEALSIATGLATINAGSHAGLNLRYILHRARQFLRNGDVAVLSMQYHYLDPLQAPVTSVLTQYVIYFDTAYLSTATWNDTMRIMLGIDLPTFLKAQARAQYPWSGFRARPDSITELGDELSNNFEKGMSGHVNVQQDQLSRLFPPAESQYFTDIWNFAAWAADRDIKIFFVWPVMYDWPGYHSQSYREFFKAIATQYEGHGIPVLGSREEYLLGADDLFDTPFHANGIGRSKLTMRLAQHLCEVMRCNPKALSDPAR